jgi:hypothetical protein
MKKKKAKQPPKEIKKVKGETPQPEKSEEEISRSEYGGLPIRDLKKNLGCG